MYALYEAVQRLTKSFLGPKITNLKLICLKLRAKIDLRNEPIISIGDQKNAEKMFFRPCITYIY